MDSEVLKCNIGVHFNNDGLAEVRVWAPEATQVQLLINNELCLHLANQQLGYWAITTGLLKPDDFYQFKLRNGEEEIIRADPAAISMPDGVHKASKAYNVNQFYWNDQDWEGLPLSNFIIYELHVGTFTAEGTFARVEAKLDHLLSLGITAIELMPVGQFPGNRNWGYDVAFPFAVQASYGGPVALQQLVDSCHKKGLAVILDVVYNHLGPEGSYLRDFGPYFTQKYQTPWGDALNFDDANCDGVRNFYIENALMWLRDFHFDALRLDAVHAIKDLSAQHFLVHLKEKVDELSALTHKKYHLLIECDLNDPKYISTSAYGYGMDAQWIDEFHHALRVASGQEKIGYYADFNGIDHLAKSFKDAYVYDGIYSNERKRFFGSKAQTDNGEKFIVFSQNHDHVGNRMHGERTSRLASPEMQKLLAGAVLCSPFLPLLFMGEEWGETNPFLFFISYSDEDLIKKVREGRKKEFEAFHAQGVAPDPQDPVTFEQSKLQWQLLEQPQHQKLLNYYRELIAIRKQNSALNHLNKRALKTYVSPAQNVMVVHRWFNEQHCLCFFNFSNKPQLVPIPETKFYWKRLMDSAASPWDPIKPEDTHLKMQPETLQIYSNKYAAS